MNERLKFIRQADNALTDLLRKAQSYLYRKISGLVNKLVVSEGLILRTPQNVRVQNEISLVLSEFKTKQNSKIATFIVRNMLKLLRLNKNYFEKFDSKQNDSVRASIMRSIGYDEQTKIVQAGSWLDQITDIQSIQLRIASEFSNGLSSNLSLNDFRARLKDVITTDKRLGLIEKQVQRLSGSVFARYDRAIQLNYAEKIGLNHAIYAGTLKDNTRDFCKKRVNRLYTREEIKSWDLEEWQGKIQGQNTLIECGGYNCRHTLNWVTDELAETLKKRKGINQFN